MPFPTTIGQGGRWRVHERLGEGNFGVVHKGRCSETDQDVAVKFEENSRRRAPNQLESEVARIQALRNCKDVPQGLIDVFYFGSDAHTFCNFAVLELLGKSLDGYATGKFTVATTVLVAEQCVQRIEYLHSRGIIHRDIKPDNVMTGIGRKSHHLYLVDYGLSQTYFDTEHCPMITNVSLVGNARYASLNNHAGLQQSRRDDLEALGYMLFQFLLGKLPWTGLSARTTEEKYKKIHEKKEATKIDELCAGLPKAFGDYLAACRALKFTERPDYRYLRDLFTDVRFQLDAASNKPLQDHDFEWSKPSSDAEELEMLEVRNYMQPDDYSSELVKEEPLFQAAL